MEMQNSVGTGDREGTHVAGAHHRCDTGQKGGGVVSLGA